MIEEDFKSNVIELARTLGWRIHHDRPARTVDGWRTALEGDPGFPDLVLARRGRLIIAELKSERGALTVEQDLWLDELDAGDGCVDHTDVRVWRPSMIQAIADELGPRP